MLKSNYRATSSRFTFGTALGNGIALHGDDGVWRVSGPTGSIYVRGDHGDAKRASRQLQKKDAATAGIPWEGEDDV